MTRDATPRITAIVATRNRGESAVATVTSLLDSDHPDFGVLVVDQSTDDSTETALAPFGDDPRFRYLRSATVGLGRAQNIGTAEVGSPYVAFTDDDCEVPREWLSCVAEVFESEPRVGLVFTNVVAGPHDRTAGFVPDYVRDGSATITSVWQKIRARGIGASMAVRREPFLDLGGFDENMGPGAVFPSAGDRDLAIRMIVADWWVHETSEAAVVHHGFRTWDEGRALTERDWIGLGAMCAKPLRTGHWTTVVYALYELVGNAILQPFGRLGRGRRPQGFRRIGYFVDGFRQGWRTPVDRETLVFVLDEKQRTAT